MLPNFGSVFTVLDCDALAQGSNWCYAEADSRHHQGKQERSPAVIAQCNCITIILIRLLLILCCMFKHTALSLPQLCVHIHQYDTFIAQGRHNHQTETCYENDWVSTLMLNT